jgi:hypothetical protein
VLLVHEEGAMVLFAIHAALTQSGCHAAPTCGGKIRVDNSTVANENTLHAGREFLRRKNAVAGYS